MSYLFNVLYFTLDARLFCLDSAKSNETYTERKLLFQQVEAQYAAVLMYEKPT